MRKIGNWTIALGVVILGTLTTVGGFVLGYSAGTTDEPSFETSYMISPALTIICRDAERQHCDTIYTWKDWGR